MSKKDKTNSISLCVFGQLSKHILLILAYFITYAQNTECIVNRYPMLVGDSQLSNVNQMLSCFDIVQQTGQFIFGGSTTSRNMTFTNSLEITQKGQLDNLKSTIFLMSMTSGSIDWSKQYINDLESSSPTQWPFQINTCGISTDQSYLAVQTIYFGLLIIDLSSGEVLKSYIHSTIPYPFNILSTSFLSATVGATYLGFNDENMQWRIVSIPLPNYASGSTSTSASQATIKIQGFSTSLSSNNTLFSGCMSSSDQKRIYFSGFFRNSTGGYVRLASFNMDTGSIETSIDGTSKDLLLQDTPTGSINCYKNAKSGQNFILAYFQVGMNLTSLSDNSNSFQFWVTQQNIPFSFTQLTLTESILTTTSKLITAQITGVAYNYQSDYPIYLIHINDISTSTATYLFYFPTKVNGLLFQQSFKGSTTLPISSRLIYFSGKLSFIGYNQQFPSFLKNSNISTSFLMQSTLKSDLSANTDDSRTCWTQQSWQKLITINTAVTKTSNPLNFYTSLSYAQQYTTYSQDTAFTETSGTTFSQDLTMSLDQIQACFSYRIAEQYSLGLPSASSSLTCNANYNSSYSTVQNKDIALGSFTEIDFQFFVQSFCPVPANSIVNQCKQEMNNFVTQLYMTGTNQTTLPSFMTFYSNNNSLIIQNPQTLDQGTYTVSAIGINNFGLSKNVTYIFKVGSGISVKPNSTSSVFSTTYNASDAECISQRYPLLIGDAFNSSNYTQTLTCFDINDKTGAQIVGGSTTSTRMASHPTNSSFSQSFSTIFLISFDKNGQVQWKNMYYNDLKVESEDQVIQGIQSCQVSTGSSYLAVTTIPYSIMLVNLTDGSVIEAYTQSTLSSPTNQNQNRFLYVDDNQIFTSYLDANQQWNIVQIPFSSSSQLGSNPDKSLYLQTQFIMSNLYQADSVQTMPFQGCYVPSSSSFYFSGIAQTYSNTVLRLGSISMGNLALSQVYEGSSSDFSSYLNGVMDCTTITKSAKSSNTYLSIAIQNSQDYSSTTGSQSLKFWLTTQSAPMSSKTIIMLETQIVGTASAVIQITSAAYDTSQGASVYLIQVKDPYHLVNDFLLYIPSMSKYLYFENKMSSASIAVSTKYLKYYSSTMCFIGNNYEFQPASSSTPAQTSFLFCTEVKSSYSANSDDSKGCWTPGSTKNAFYFNNNLKNTITLSDVTSTQKSNFQATQNFDFTYNQDFADVLPLTRVLDSYQPCYQLKIDLFNQSTVTSQPKVCYPNQTNLESASYTNKMQINQTLSQVVNFNVSLVCPAIDSKLSSQCQSYLNSFKVSMISKNDPGFLTYNQTTQILSGTPTNNSWMLQSFQALFSGTNKYGMSADFTYQIDIARSTIPKNNSATGNTSNVQCIPKRYPMLFGDSFTTGVKQAVSCFELDPTTGNQIVGGQTTSSNMAYHAKMAATGQTAKNLLYTTFLINSDANGQILWSNQYFNDLTNTDPSSFVYNIQACKLSFDQSYLAVMTSPFYIFTVNLTDGGILNQYQFLNPQNQQNISLNSFLFANTYQIFAGYVDDYLNWNIIQLPFDQSVSQIKYSYSGFKNTTGSYSQLFSGCVPFYDSNYLYFSGFFQDKSTKKGTVRISKLDYSNYTLVSNFNGTSTLFTSQVSGFMECQTTTSSEDLIQIVIQNYQDLQTMNGSSSLTFFLVEYKVPFSSSVLTINAYTLNGYTNSIAQLVGATYKQDTATAMYLLQIKSITDLINKNIIYIPSLSKTITFQQQMSSSSVMPMLKSLKYYSSRICFAGYNQEFPDYLTTLNMPTSYLLCSQLKSDFTPNLIDVRSCWIPQSQSSGFTISSQSSSNDLLLKSDLSSAKSQFAAGVTTSFSLPTYSLQSEPLFMILDQYQPCYQFQVSPASSTTTASTTSNICNPSAGSQREIIAPKQIVIGTNSSFLVNFSAPIICPTFTSSISKQCTSYLNDFSTTLLTSLPGFVNFNSTSKMLIVNTSNKTTNSGIYNVSFLALNKFGMTLNYTYQLQVQSDASTPIISGNDCIQKRYPMLIGDNHQTGVKQKLTCFNINKQTGAQIIGGSTSSYSMTYHSKISTNSSDIASNIQSTIFLINLNADGTVAWRKQYYNDRLTTRADQYFFEIMNCQISTDSRYIAVSTDPFNLLAISLSDGSIQKAYVFRTQQTLNYYNLQKMMFAIPETTIIGYTDENYQWRIVNVPVPSAPSKQYISQQQVLFSGYVNSSTSYSMLFEGCISNSDPLTYYFSGFFTNKTNKYYYRFGGIDLFSLELTSLLDGTSTDMLSQATGFMKCGTNAQTLQDYLILVIQNYQSISGSQIGSGSTATQKFWILTQNLPLTQLSYKLSEYQITSSTKMNIQIASVANKDDVSQETVILIQAFDYTNQINYNIIYFYEKNLQIVYSQGVNNINFAPFTGTLQYYKNSLCFIGQNQTFPSFLTLTKPSIYLQCTQLTSTYAPNMQDTKSCWAPLSSSSFSIQATNKSAITATSTIDSIDSNYLTFQDDIFVETTSLVNVVDLFMVLDIYQPCYQLQTQLNLQYINTTLNYTNATQTCNANRNIPRNYQYSKTVNFSTPFMQYIQPSFTSICPNFVSADFSYCNYKMNSFKPYLLTDNLPKFVSFDSTSNLLFVAPYNQSDSGNQNIILNFVNDFGLSANVTYLLTINGTAVTPNKTTNATSNNSKNSSNSTLNNSNISNGTNGSTNASSTSSSKLPSSSSSSPAMNNTNTSNATSSSSSPIMNNTNTSNATSSSSSSPTSNTSASSSSSQSNQGNTSTQANNTLNSTSNSTGNTSANTTNSTNASSLLNSTGSLKAKINSFSSDNKLTVSFSDPILIPKVQQTVINKAISVNLAENNQTINSTWNVTTLNESTMIVQVVPSKNTSESQSDQIAIQLFILDPNLFVSSKTLKPIDSSSILIYYRTGLPPVHNQVLVNNEPLSTSEILQNTQYYAQSSGVAVSTLTGVIFGPESQLCASMTGTMQMMSYLPLMNISLPTSTLDYFKNLRASSYDFLAINDLVQNKQLDTSQKQNQTSRNLYPTTLTSQTAYNYNYERMNFKTVYLFSNCANLICLNVVMIIGLVIYYFAKRLFTFCCVQEEDDIDVELQKYLPKKSNSILIGIPSLFFKQSFLPITFFSILNLVGNDYNMTSAYSIFNLILSVAYLCIMVILVFFIAKQVFTINKRIKNREQSIYGFYSFIFGEYKEGQKYHIHILIFIALKVVYALLLVFLTKSPLAQLSIMLVLQLTMIAYLLLFKPFAKRMRLVLELFNELTLLACFSIAFALVPSLNQSDQQKTKAVYALIGFISGNVIVNISFVIVQIIFGIIEAIQKLRNKKTQSQIMKVSNYDKDTQLSKINQFQRTGDKSSYLDGTILNQNEQTNNKLNLVSIYSHHDEDIPAMNNQEMSPDKTLQSESGGSVRVKNNQDDLPKRTKMPMVRPIQQAHLDSVSANQNFLTRQKEFQTTAMNTNAKVEVKPENTSQYYRKK